MAAAFADLQTQVNASVFEALANVRTVIDFVELDGIFEPSYALGGVGTVGMAATAPVLSVRTDQLESDPVGYELEIDDTTYRVAAHEPDGAGVSRLLLERMS